MREELSSVDLFYLVRELQLLLDGKIDKIFQEKEYFLFQIYVPNQGNKYLKIFLPSFIFITETKNRFNTLGKYAASLRKHLKNARIVGIRMLDFERIIEFEFSLRERILFLYIELFKPGNIILTDSEKKIIMAKEYKGFGSRLIRPRIEYKWPRKKYNILSITEDNFSVAFENTDKRSPVITLAVDFGFGGMYSEEFLHEFNQQLSKKKITKRTLTEIYSHIQKNLSRKIDAQIVFANNNSIDAIPFKLNKYSSHNLENAPSFSAALDRVFTKKTEIKEQKKETNQEKKETNQINIILKKQQNQIAGLEKAYTENKNKGEKIYENYEKIRFILENIQSELKTQSFTKLRKNMKTDVLIKDFNAKEKRIVIDI